MRNTEAFVAVRKSAIDGVEYYDQHSVADTEFLARHAAAQWDRANPETCDPVVRIAWGSLVEKGGK